MVAQGEEKNGNMYGLVTKGLIGDQYAHGVENNLAYQVIGVFLIETL